jgi:plastocyanin domain-containing protein
MVEVTPKWTVSMSKSRIRYKSKGKEMRTTSPARILVGIGTMIFLATSLCPTINGQAHRRTKRKPTAVQRVTIKATEQGYQPAVLRLRRSIPAKLTFIRTVTNTCGTQIVLLDYGVKRDLPLNVPIVVEFTPRKSGEFSLLAGWECYADRLS